MQCDVTDLQGNHCPEIPEHTVMFDGVEIHLCKRCFANVVAGTYGHHLTPRAADWGYCTCPKSVPRYDAGDGWKCHWCHRPRR